MMGWYGDGVGWGGWLVMSLTMVGFWALVVFAVVVMFRGSRDGGPVDSTAPVDPQRILDERFARGEIDADEYQARKSVLRASSR